MTQAIPFSRCGVHPRFVRQCEESSEAVRYFVRARKRRAVRNDGWQERSYERSQERKPRNKARKRNAERRVVQRTAPCSAARADRCALASRRPTTALAAANERHSSTQATRFLGRYW